MNKKLLSTVVFSCLSMLASPSSMAVFSGGMFLYAENSPVSTFAGGKVGSPRSGAELKEKGDLLLSANIPGGVFVPDDKVVWQVTAPNGGKRYQLAGNRQQLSLPDGQYDICLLIGAYQEQANIQVLQGQQAVPMFHVKIGNLRAFSGMPVSWDVYELDGGIAARKIVSRASSTQLNEIVPAGEYEMRAALDSSSFRQRVIVPDGGVVDANVNVPVGKVSLVATLNDGPAMRPMSWKVYSLDGGHHEVAALMRHSVTLEVAPGRYEAVATLGGVERRREFTVNNGSSNEVVLAMD